ncbi:MAG TPA: FAD-dependent oxidoreductase [Bacteroidia bacterium]|nr:FAD-dependent oxidoreductase [Bacteroidia bacterium]
MAYTFYNSEVVEIIDVTPLVKRFFFQIPEMETFNFAPGQFVQLDLPIESKIKTRSYSIASAPEGTNIIELVISLNAEGLGTPYLFNEIKVGSKLPLSQPAGKFMKPPVATDVDICMVCTGTGIAPFRSFLKDLIHKNTPYKKIDLIFGTRYEKDVLYMEEMEALSQTLPGFSFTTVLSREPNPSIGKKGYVHQVYQELYADKRPANFYLCGWKVMIKEAIQNLQDMGYDKKAIKFELYD